MRECAVHQVVGVSAGVAGTKPEPAKETASDPLKPSETILKKITSKDCFVPETWLALFFMIFYGVA